MAKLYLRFEGKELKEVTVSQSAVITIGRLPDNLGHCTKDENAFLGADGTQSLDFGHRDNPARPNAHVELLAAPPAQAPAHENQLSAKGKRFGTTDAVACKRAKMANTATALIPRFDCWKGLSLRERWQ